MKTTEELNDYQHVINTLKCELYETQKRLEKAERILFNMGYFRCEIVACNCGSYHRTN